MEKYQHSSVLCFGFLGANIFLECVASYIKKKNRQNKTRQKSSDLSEPHGILTKVIVYAIVVTSEGFPLILNTTDILIEPAMISRY